MREIVLDTETTGLDPYQGHRLVEVGCIELINRIPSGQVFHRYLNPERDMPAEAFSVHGLSADFLKDKPPFAEIAEEFLGFVGDARLVIHNAAFDIGFLNAELERAGRKALSRDRLVDTLLLARRTKHGALLDAELLAEVYLELVEARQAQLGLAVATGVIAGAAAVSVRPRPTALTRAISAIERAAHRAFVATLGVNAIWRDYLDLDSQPEASKAPGSS
jgi:DNA polymerase-3 subunit epsilon